MEIIKLRSKKLKRLAIGLTLLLVLLIVFVQLVPKASLVRIKSVENNISRNPDTTTQELLLHIAEKDFLKVKAQRDREITKGVLFSNDKDLVNAVIEYKGKKLPAEIRLKGDWTTHLEGIAWSFRVKLRDNHTLDGMRKFSLQHPESRNFAGEWLFHEMLKANDIINLRYNFANTKMLIDRGGEKIVRDLGYYTIEEFFDKQLIEYNKRKEGIIMKIDEDPIWMERRQLMADSIWSGAQHYFTVNQYENLTIMPFGAARILKDPNLKMQFEKGKALFEGYVDQKIPASRAFDVKKLADYNAICNILGANHSMILHNLRVYYNPINSKLEPIGFDGNATQKYHYFPKIANTENDLVFLEHYAAALERVISDEYFEKILNWPGLKGVVETMTKLHPWYSWKEEILTNNRLFIQGGLFPAKSLNIFYLDHSRDEIRLSLENYSNFPVEVSSLNFDNGKILGLPEGRIIIPAGEKVAVAFKSNKDFQRVFVSKKMGKLTFDPLKDLTKLKVICNTLGTTSRPREERIFPWKPGNFLPLDSDIFQRKTNFAKNKDFVVDEENKIIAVKQGYHIFTEPIFVPRGYTFRIYEGTEIDFNSKDRFIISYSPVEFLGSKSKPIRFKSTGSDGRGLLVLNTTEASILEHCIFENLAPPNSKHWAVSGAINFYDAPVKIYNCTFKDMRSEDALNIISTTFEMDNCHFSNSYSDAFDGDFVKGNITNTTFQELGNDAIDVSGSDIYLEKIIINRASDKGLSAGENSKMRGKNIFISNSEIAVASKDQSVIEISNCQFENNKLGFTAYQKKSEYGPASIIADSIQSKNSDTPYLIEKYSSLILNGTEVEVVNRVLDRMYGTEFGKKSQ